MREAVLMLSARGLVEIVPRTGIYVRQLRANELVAMMEALGELEAVLARLATLRITPALREDLECALDGTAKQARFRPRRCS